MGLLPGPRPALYVNNTFINHYGFHGGADVGRTETAAWAHNPYFRRAAPYSSAAVAGRYGAGREVVPGVRTPRGAAGAISGLNGAAAGIRTSGAAAGAISGPNGAAADIRTAP